VRRSNPVALWSSPHLTRGTLCKNVSDERQPLTGIPITWCDFSAEEIKIIRNKKAFNKGLKDHFLNKLKGTAL
jgi:hypothetical protein